MGVFGPDTPQSGRAIPSFIDSILSEKPPVLIGEGKSRRNHVHLDDAINAIINSLKCSKGGIFNIGGKDSPNNLELVSIINEITGKNVVPTHKDQEKKEPNFILDNSLASKEINYFPSIGIKNGLVTQIENWRKSQWMTWKTKKS